MADVTLEFIAEQMRRSLDEHRATRDELAAAREERAAMRDDMAVLLAIVQRLDGTMQGLVAEVRAQHSRHDRLARHVARIEERLPREPEPSGS